jgi:hypothetical protein
MVFANATDLDRKSGGDLQTAILFGSTFRSARAVPRDRLGGERLYAVILEMRNDEVGEFYHLVTLWKATRQEQELYEEHS